MDSETLEAGIERHPEGVEGHRHEAVLPDREDEIHELFLRPGGGESRPGFVADERFLVELVGRAEDRRFVRSPARSVRPRLDAFGGFLVESAPASDDHMPRPFVLRPAEPSDPQDRDLALAGRSEDLAST